MNTQTISTLQAADSGSASDTNDRLWESAATKQPPARGRRRQDPRVHVLIPVRLRQDGGRNLTTMLHDISLTGFQVRCDEQSFQGLGLEQPAADTPDGMLMKVSCELPLTGGEQVLQAAGRVVHFTRIEGEPERSRYAVGFAFEAFEDGGDAVLARYVEEQLMPVEWESEWC
ncbi:MAG: PilZ domain-containing protein [Gammaproteobacteria bacterium]|nr:PilZ domain-containing protein [Gammaproteobacteria bacterium]